MRWAGAPLVVHDLTSVSESLTILPRVYIDLRFSRLRFIFLLFSFIHSNKASTLHCPLAIIHEILSPVHCSHLRSPLGRAPRRNAAWGRPSLRC